jgi:hypothetical protein
VLERYAHGSDWGAFAVPYPHGQAAEQESIGREFAEVGQILHDDQAVVEERFVGGHIVGLHRIGRRGVQADALEFQAPQVAAGCLGEGGEVRVVAVGLPMSVPPCEQQNEVKPFDIRENGEIGLVDDRSRVGASVKRCAAMSTWVPTWVLRLTTVWANPSLFTKWECRTLAVSSPG